MYGKCEIKKRPAQPMMSVRARTAVEKLPEILGKAFGDVAMAIGEQGQQPIGPPFVAYYNMDMRDLDIEIGFTVAKRLQAKGEIKPGEIPAGKAATCVYTGPYGDGMKEAYEALRKLMEDNGQVPKGVAYEIYFNSPMDTPPEKLQTQIMFPLEGD